MRLRLFARAGIATALLCASAMAFADGKLTLYTSMRDSLADDLKAAFIKKHPDVKMEVQTGGAGKLMAMVAAERDSGAIQGDMLWTGEVADFYLLKSQGALLPYVPAEIKSVVNPFKDYDGSFTAVRLATLGIAYNTRFVNEPPTSWQDVHKPMFKGAFGIANPALSGTAYMGVAMLVKAFGWSYFEALRANDAKVGKGTATMAEETEAGDLLASLASDAVVTDRVESGAPLALAYPPEMLVIPSPIAILNGSDNVAEARLFIDFLLSTEGQTVIAEAGLLPVRPDVAVPARFGIPSVAETMKRAIKFDYQHPSADRDATIRHFGEIMQR
jgi:iron(III) transport system substrate-binding protein